MRGQKPVWRSFASYEPTQSVCELRGLLEAAISYCAVEALPYRAESWTSISCLGTTVHLPVVPGGPFQHDGGNAGAAHMARIALEILENQPADPEMGDMQVGERAASYLLSVLGRDSDDPTWIACRYKPRGSSDDWMPALGVYDSARAVDDWQVIPDDVGRVCATLFPMEVRPNKVSGQWKLMVMEHDYDVEVHPMDPMETLRLTSSMVTSDTNQTRRTGRP